MSRKVGLINRAPPAEPEEFVMAKQFIYIIIPRSKRKRTYRYVIKIRKIQYCFIFSLTILCLSDTTTSNTYTYESFH